MFIHVDLRKWARLLPTPIWLRIADANWKPSNATRKALAALEHAVPPRLLQDSTNPLFFSAPLHPRLGVERDIVIADLMRQLEEVYAELDKIPNPGVAAAVLPSEETLGGGDETESQGLPA